MDNHSLEIIRKPHSLENKGTIDAVRIERAVREILHAIGEDPQREGLRDTPKRVARAYSEMFAGLRADPAEALGTVFNESHRDIVIVRDITVSSFCEHHLLPFTGKASVGYIPGHDGGVVGLSKLARLVDVFARRPQVQERLTTQIADALETILAPEGIIVVLECEHSCMSIRGVKRPDSRTITTTLRGVLRDDPQKQTIAYNLLKSGS